MANYYFTIPDSVTLPTDGNKVSLTTACELHRDDSALPNALTVAADSYNVFLADTPGTGTATVPATAPAAFTSGQWTAATGSGASEIDINITALPSDGGSSITALQYSVDSGTTWANLTGTGTGSRTIDQHSDGTTGTLTAATSYNIEVRAVNAVGNGSDSDTKATTTGAASSGFTDTFAYTGNLEDQAGWTPLGVGVGDKPEADGSDAFLTTNINSEWFMEANQDLADNQYCEVTITDVGSGFGNQYNLFVRATDRNNFYCVEIRENTIKDIDSYSGGVATELASNDTVISNGDVVRLAASGTSITVTVNGGAPIMTGTSSANTSGRAGIWFDFVGASQTTSTKIGLFEADDL